MPCLLFFFFWRDACASRPPAPPPQHNKSEREAIQAYQQGCPYHPYLGKRLLILFSTANILAPTQIIFQFLFNCKRLVSINYFPSYPPFPPLSLIGTVPVYGQWSHFGNIRFFTAFSHSRVCSVLASVIHPMEFLACYSISLIRHILLTIGL